jgi:hypothetical protein
MSNLTVLNWVFILAGAIFLFSDIVLTRVVVKSGVPRWWAILFMIPIVNIAMLWMFAMGKGPALREQ